MIIYLKEKCFLSLCVQAFEARTDTAVYENVHRTKREIIKVQIETKIY